MHENTPGILPERLHIVAGRMPLRWESALSHTWKLSPEEREERLHILLDEVRLRTHNSLSRISLIRSLSRLGKIDTDLAEGAIAALQEKEGAAEKTEMKNPKVGVDASFAYNLLRVAIEYFWPRLQEENLREKLLALEESLKNHITFEGGLHVANILRTAWGLRLVSDEEFDSTIAWAKEQSH